ncbi:MAG: Fe-S cluster assembly protein SufD [Actinomycetota bacterium]
MAFSREDVEALSAALGEPGWVLERRLAAWSTFESMELPREKQEPWRYTDLRRLKFRLDGFSPIRPGTANELTSEARALLGQEGERAGYIVQRDADVVLKQLDAGLGKQGVVLTDIHTAVAEHGDFLKEHLFGSVDVGRHLLTALHGAMFCGGTFLYVPRGTSVTVPVESQRWIDQAGGSIFPHTLIIVEEGAELLYFERLRSPDLDGPALSNGAVEIVCGQGSRVTFASLQEYSEEVWHFAAQRAVSSRDVTLRSLVVTLGGRFSRIETDGVIRGQGSSSEMLGLYFAEHGQHFDHRTLQDHVAGGSTSDLLYKGALKDESRSVYSGLIRVHEQAAKTDAYQLNRNLVLSDNAKADTKPELEIKNNDLRCTHGASVGQIDENELFYLQTRGIDSAEAQRLIVTGFFEDVITRIRIEEVRAVLHDAIERKLEGSWRRTDGSGSPRRTT